MIHNLKVIQFYNEIIDGLNATNKKHEKIVLIRLMKEEWSQENELLTTTLKLKRMKINDVYKKEIEDMYESKLQ